ncbi:MULTISPECIES: LacI family DNA-binding transcriptional regulator [Deinococcus]|uniref:LacI family DNA-binding transcriptional regulator n=1 Tax=Deinococcus rufus TaxID=2136097 RepID=A0ABV7Z592_9DEIO|nr:LacI family DNA-binding transcriptional regulator [Deinococcus sp. AB2017081]WQE96275.1 LacI family DNA-binding transcriptional regulator [Deinococcus sp. AB2017081]
MPPAKPSAASAARGGRITLREVAQALDVSVATVSNAYNRPDQLSRELRERILDTARSLGYRGPDPLARSLRRGRTGVIGVVYDAPLEYAFADPAAAMFLGSVAHALQEHALNLLLLASPEDVSPVSSASVDGFIVYCAAEGSDLLTAVMDRGLPTVLVDQYPHPPAVQIGIDDAGGAREAAAHLQALGHRHVGVLCLELGPDAPGGPVSVPREQVIGYRTSAERLAGYRAGAPQATIYPSEVAQNTPDEGEHRAVELLTAHPAVTALLCMSDVIAQGALRGAHRLGLSVPDDLSIIGYDDLPSSAALGLSTVWQPTADKGRHVGETLLALLAGRAATNVTLPTRLVVRESTARPRP